jgi:CO/xanthine dehydrogenase FAD-binding subunit
MSSYYRPSQLEDALGALHERSLTILAGGTDFYPSRVGVPLDDHVLDITRIDQLRAIEEPEAGTRIGALVTWTDVLRKALPPWFDGLRQCAREVGAVQTQNAGTVVGNLCNASPAADGTPCLMTLDARVELTAADGRRTVPVADFVTGVRRTALRENEMVTGILIPKPANEAAAGFAKLGNRRYMVISIAATAAVLEKAADGTVAAARIAVGACSPVALRLGGLEARLVGKPVSRSLGEAVVADDLHGLAPIDDLRGSAEYRLDAALTLVRRMVSETGARL